MTSAQFDNVSVIITTFLYKLTELCSPDNRLDWSTVNYLYFVNQLKTIPGASNTNSTAFSIDQLEQLMRKLSASYIPGDQSVLEKPATRSDDVSLLCAVGNIRVIELVHYLEFRLHLPVTMQLEIAYV
jgi:hypothetical protein